MTSFKDTRKRTEKGLGEKTNSAIITFLRCPCGQWQQHYAYLAEAVTVAQQAAGTLGKKDSIDQSDERVICFIHC